MVSVSLHRIEHQRLHEKHRGHEAMHAEMAIILLLTLVVAQIALVQWKLRHFKSYQVSSLLCWLSCLCAVSILLHHANEQIHQYHHARCLHGDGPGTLEEKKTLSDQNTQIAEKSACYF